MCKSVNDSTHIRTGMHNLEIPSEVNENDYVDYDYGYDYVTTYFSKVNRNSQR